MSRLIGAPIRDSVAMQSPAAQLFALRPGDDCSTVGPLGDHVWATGFTSAAGSGDLT